MFLAHECNLGNQTTKVLQAKAAALYYCILVVMKIWSYRCIECLFKTIYTEPSATIWDGKGTVPLLLLSLLLKRPNETQITFDCNLSNGWLCWECTANMPKFVNKWVVRVNWTKRQRKLNAWNRDNTRVVSMKKLSFFPHYISLWFLCLPLVFVSFSLLILHIRISAVGPFTGSAHWN